MKPDRRHLLTSRTRRKLNQLRRAIRVNWATEAVAWAAVVVAAVVVVTLTCDWGLSRLTRQPVGLSLRFAVMFASLAVAAVTIWRRGLRWVGAHWSDDELALLVQRQYPQLGDGLISAVQLAPGRIYDRAEVSPAMVAETARQANAAAESLDFRAVLDRRKWTRRGFMASGAIVLVGALALLAPQTMHLWFLRNVMMTDVPWPRQTYLTIDGPTDLAVLRGGDLRVEVRALSRSEVIPDEVVFHLAYLASGRVNEAVERTDETASYVKTFRNVSEPFSFHVTGYDGRTAVRRVRVVEPAEVRRIRCTVEYPGYMGRPARSFDGVAEAVSVSPGSWVTVQAEATKPLSAARLLLDDRDVGDVIVRPVTLTDGGEPVPGVAGRFQLTADPGGRRVMTLRLSLTDAEGYANPQPFRLPIHVLYDQPPVITVGWLATGKSITAQAVVPVSIEATDDCGLVALGAEAAVKGSSADPVSLPIRSFDPPRTRETIARYRLDLAPLGLTIGDTVRLTIVATDSLPAEIGGPNVRRSDTREFHVISEADLLARLLDRQKQMRLRMQQTLEAQAAARDLVKAAADQAAGEGGADEARRLTADGARKQQTAATYAGTIAATYRSIVRSLADNRAGDPAEREQMIRQIAEPLEALIGEPMPAVLATLDSVRDDAGSPGAAAQLTDMAGRQDGFYQRLDTIMQSMAQLEGIQELARMLTGVITVTEEVKKGIEKRLDVTTGGLFD